MRLKKTTKPIHCMICEKTHVNATAHHRHLLDNHHQEQAKMLEWRLWWKTINHPTVLLIDASYVIDREFSEGEDDGTKIVRLMNHITKETGVLIRDFCGSGMQYLPKRGYLQFLDETSLEKVFQHFRRGGYFSICCVEIDDSYVYMSKATDLPVENWNMKVDFLVHKHFATRSFTAETVDGDVDSNCTTEGGDEFEEQVQVVVQEEINVDGDINLPTKPGDAQKGLGIEKSITMT